MKLYKVNGKTFRKALMKAKDISKYGAFLSMESERYYNENINYLNDSGTAGVSITPDGYITGVFNISGNKAISELINAAINSGGNNLDCFSGYLDNLYSKFGFKITETIEFDDNYAPNDWNYKAFGRPPVVAMVLS